MAAAQMGGLGRLLGDADHAPTFIAFLATYFGVCVGAACLITAAAQPAESEFWSKQSDHAFTFASLALGFIFGKGSK
jgi:hypothetical protein